MPRAALAAGITATASADGGYEAKFIGQSAYLTLESGQRATSYFDAQNVGTATWTNDVVRLGTTNPRDRSSAFASSTWINAARATPLDEPFVEPDKVVFFATTSCPARHRRWRSARCPSTPRRGRRW